MTRVLLLLPVVRIPADRTELWKQYRPAIRQVLKDLSRGPNVLDVALLFNGGSDAERSWLFSAFQTLLADVYTLVCSTASQLKIDLDFGEGIYVNCIAVDAPFETTISKQQYDYNGPFTAIEAFSSSRLPYDFVYSTGSAQDIKKRLPAELQHLINSPTWQNLGQSNIDPSISEFTLSDAALDASKIKTHTRVAVGGTFDHLHIGHKLLLTATVFIAQPGSEDREITIGITGDELLVNKKHADVLESWEIRQHRCAEFVESILAFDTRVSSFRETINIDQPGPNGKVVQVVYSPKSSGRIKVNYTQISDPFGPTITDESITALIISGETRAGGEAVNDKRTEKGWHPLEVFEVDVLDAGAVELGQETASSTKSTFNSKISSTEIRWRLATSQQIERAGV